MNLETEKEDFVETNSATQEKKILRLKQHYKLKEREKNGLLFYLLLY